MYDVTNSLYNRGAKRVLTLVEFASYEKQFPTNRFGGRFKMRMMCFFVYDDFIYYNEDYNKKIMLNFNHVYYYFC